MIGAVLTDGPGLAGGATFPTSQSFFMLPQTDAPPDPYVLAELSRDLRPPDYAAAFVRLSVAARAWRNRSRRGGRVPAAVARSRRR